MANSDDPAQQQGGILGFIERTGNKLPDPVFIFFYLIIGLIVLSVVFAFFGFSALHPAQFDESGNPVVVTTSSLLSAENLQRLWTEMPKTFTHFHPLGYVLVIMLGAGVAERSGMFTSAMRLVVGSSPKSFLTPVVALVAMLGNHAVDAGYVVLIPLAAIVYASAGRHPLAGISTAFAGVSGGFSANVTPGQLDALLFGITQEAVDASQMDPGYVVNIAGNWYFIAAMFVIYLPLIWYVTDRIIEPRLGKWGGNVDDTGKNEDEKHTVDENERKGLRRALFALIGVTVLWIIFTVGPGTPLIDEQACSEGSIQERTCSIHQTLKPFYNSFVAAFFLLFLATGWAYGSATGSISNHRDLVDMMTESMKDMGYYLVLAFSAAHLVAMFNWSNLAIILSVHGANGIKATGLPMFAVIGMIVVFSGILNLFIGSASAKWALLAPILVPMLMQLNLSPEAATAAYRVGDSATNIITPLMVYFPLILVFARRWQKDFGLGSLTAIMIPYSLALLVSGIILTMFWIGFNIDLGGGASVTYELVTQSPR